MLFVMSWQDKYEPIKTNLQKLSLPKTQTQFTENIKKLAYFYKYFTQFVEVLKYDTSMIRK